MEIDETLDLTAKVFHGGVRSSHNISIGSPSVRELRDALCERLQYPLNKHTIVLVYCGRTLHLDNSLSHYNIKKGSCVNVIVNDLQVKDDSVPDIRVGKETLLRLFAPPYQYMTKNVLNNSDTVNDIANKLPALDKDLVAQGILKDFNMLAMMSAPDAIDGLLENHPSIAAAAVHLSRIVIPKAEKDNSIDTSIPRRGNRYAIDSMFEEEDDDQPAAPRHTITAGQLAAALAGAQGAVTSANSSAASTTPAPPIRTQSGASSSNQTRASSSAMSTVPTTHTQPSEAEAKYESQLQQMINMGISDRALALRALEASGGNVDLALGIIYGGDI